MEVGYLRKIIKYRKPTVSPVIDAGPCKQNRMFPKTFCDPIIIPYFNTCSKGGGKIMHECKIELQWCFGQVEFILRLYSFCFKTHFIDCIERYEVFPE